MVTYLKRRDILRKSIQKTKIMPKTKKAKTSSSIWSQRRFVTALVLVVFSVLAVGGYGRLVKAVSCSSVADCQSQIGNLSAQNADSQQKINSLQLQAQGYQGAIDALTAQINALQASI